jgi:hypothetical protein
MSDDRHVDDEFDELIAVESNPSTATDHPEADRSVVGGDWVGVMAGARVGRPDRGGKNLPEPTQKLLEVWRAAKRASDAAGRVADAALEAADAADAATRSAHQALLAAGLDVEAADAVEDGWHS